MSVDAMSLVGVFSPDTETELVAIVEMLEARAVPCFVSHPASSAAPGRRGKSRTILVPAPQLAEAVRLIGDLRRSRPARLESTRAPRGLLRALGRLFSAASRRGG